MSKLDPNEAPEGYLAVQSILCDGCALSGSVNCSARLCDSGFRKDGCGVIFIKKLGEEKMTEWVELKTLQEVAEAQARGDEIEWLDDDKTWYEWFGECWKSYLKFRSRPRKKTKTVVLREALLKDPFAKCYVTIWATEGYVIGSTNFIKWLDTPSREVEVEE